MEDGNAIGFTDRARRALGEAAAEAREDGQQLLGTEHLLLGLVRLESGVAYEVLVAAGVSYESLRAAVSETIGLEPGVDRDALAAIGIDLDALRRAAEESFGPGALDRAMWEQRYGTRPMPLTREAMNVLKLSGREAISLNDTFIATEHILLAILDEGNGGAVDVLTRLAPDIDLRNLVLEHLRSSGHDPELDTHGGGDARDEFRYGVRRR